MAEPIKTATLTLDGKAYEFPVHKGSIGPEVIDIGKAKPKPLLLILVSPQQRLAIRRLLTLMAMKVCCCIAVTRLSNWLKKATS
jgi:hypothetical protein